MGNMSNMGICPSSEPEGSERASPSESRGDEEGDEGSAHGTVVENASDNGTTVLLDERIELLETAEPTDESHSEGDGSVDETVVGAGDPEEERDPTKINMRGDRTTGPRHEAHRRTKACDANDPDSPVPLLDLSNLNMHPAEFTSPLPGTVPPPPQGVRRFEHSNGRIEAVKVQYLNELGERIQRGVDTAELTEFGDMQLFENHSEGDEGSAHGTVGEPESVSSEGSSADSGPTRSVQVHELDSDDSADKSPPEVAHSAAAAEPAENGSNTPQPRASSQPRVPSGGVAPAEQVPRLDISDLVHPPEFTSPPQPAGAPKDAPVLDAEDAIRRVEHSNGRIEPQSPAAQEGARVRVVPASRVGGQGGWGQMKRRERDAIRRHIERKQTPRRQLPDLLGQTPRPKTPLRAPGFLSGPPLREGDKMVKQLGEGSFGRVFLIEHDGEQLALKQPKVRGRREERTEWQLESKLLQRCREHQHIVRWEAEYRDRGVLLIVTEFAANGNLRSWIIKKERDRENVMRWFTQICDAVEHLHVSLGILHRDLKPENIFLTAHGDIKVGDFGLAMPLGKSGQKASEYCGTKAYMAPEIRARKRYGYPADMWALGCILYELATGRLHFEDDNATRRKQLRGDASFCEAFVSRLLKHKPEQRSTASELLKELRLREDRMREQQRRFAQQQDEERLAAEREEGRMRRDVSDQEGPYRMSLQKEMVNLVTECNHRGQHGEACDANEPESSPFRPCGQEGVVHKKPPAKAPTQEAPIPLASLRGRKHRMWEAEQKHIRRQTPRLARRSP